MDVLVDLEVAVMGRCTAPGRAVCGRLDWQNQEPEMQTSGSQVQVVGVFASRATGFFGSSSERRADEQ
jgi:hypothetical protein